MQEGTIGKCVLGMRYYPNIKKESARKKLIGYLKDHKDWHPHDDFDDRNYFLPSEVRQVEKIMME